MELPTYYREILNLKFQRIVSFLRNGCLTCNGEGTVKLNYSFSIDYCPDCMQKFNALKPQLEANIAYEYVNLSFEESTYKADIKEKLIELSKNAEQLMGQMNILFCKPKLGISYGITTAGCIMLKQYINLGYSGFFINFSELIDLFLDFKEDKKQNKQRTEMQNFLSQVEVLVVDNFCSFDVKKETKEGFFFQNASKFLLHRVNKGMTILCSDYDYMQILETFPIFTPTLKGNFLPILIEGNDASRPTTTQRIKSLNVSENLKKMIDKDIKKITPKSPDITRN